MGRGEDGRKERGWARWVEMGEGERGRKGGRESEMGGGGKRDG